MSSVTAEREIKGFKYSFAVEMDALSIEALHIQTGRLWKALLNSLSFCSRTAAYLLRNSLYIPSIFIFIYFYFFYIFFVFEKI